VHHDALAKTIDASFDAKPTAALRVDRGHPARVTYVTYADAHDCSACPQILRIDREMRLRDRNQPIQTLAANRADGAFADRIRPGTSGVVILVPSARDSQIDFVQDSLAKMVVVAIVQQVLVVCFVANRFTQLLKCPKLEVGCRVTFMCRQGRARAMLNCYQDIQQLKTVAVTVHKESRKRQLHAAWFLRNVDQR